MVKIRSLRELQLKDVKKYGAWLKVQGAYVQQPDPSVVGLEKDIVVASFDASALYPTIEILFNIGYETLKHRVYDTGIHDNFINLIYTISKNKGKLDIVKPQATKAFEIALDNLIKNYTSRKSVGNKTEFTDVNKLMLMRSFEKIIDYLLDPNPNNTVENLFSPKTDQEYFLLRSNFYLLMESIYWLSERNKGYCEFVVDWGYLPNQFHQKYQDKKIYIFTDIHSTKLNFKILSLDEIIPYFEKYVINPYGVLFTKHEEYLSFNASENIKGLSRRRQVKNAMLALRGLYEAKNRLPENHLKLFLNKIKESKKDAKDSFGLNEQELFDIFMIVDKNHESSAKKKTSSLKDFEFLNTFIDDISTMSDDQILEDFFDWINLRVQQLDNVQQGIKVSLNSGYGILGLISYQYSSPLAGNSITTGGKIVGIKTFQQIAVNAMHAHYKQN